MPRVSFLLIFGGISVFSTRPAMVLLQCLRSEASRGLPFSSSDARSPVSGSICAALRAYLLASMMNKVADLCFLGRAHFSSDAIEETSRLPNKIFWNKAVQKIATEHYGKVYVCFRKPCATASHCSSWKCCTNNLIQTIAEE